MPLEGKSGSLVCSRLVSLSIKQQCRESFLLFTGVLAGSHTITHIRARFLYVCTDNNKAPKLSATTNVTSPLCSTLKGVSTASDGRVLGRGVTGGRPIITKCHEREFHGRTERGRRKANSENGVFSKCQRTNANRLGLLTRRKPFVGPLG